MKKLIVAVTNKKYLNHVYSLFGNLQTIGNYKGDLGLVCSELLTYKDYEFLGMKNIHILQTCKENINPFYAKLYLFSEFFKKWDRVIYFDADFIIRKDVNPLFDQTDDLLMDQEEFYIWQYLSDKDLNCLNRLKNRINLDVLGWNSSCISYNTNIIEKDTLTRLFECKNDIQPINQHTGLSEGTEQPVLNVFFYDKIKQINKICYISRIKDETVAAHTCRWAAPWSDNRFIDYYNLGFAHFIKDLM